MTLKQPSKKEDILPNPFKICLCVRCIPSCLLSENNLLTLNINPHLFSLSVLDPLLLAGEKSPVSLSGRRGFGRGVRWEK